ncbi:hypothetical protein Tco_1088280 [Tanacetum coccineum]
MFGYHGVLLVPSFETAGRGPETDYLSPSYALLNKGPFFTRSWASRNKMARSSILVSASDCRYTINLDDQQYLVEAICMPSQFVRSITAISLRDVIMPGVNDEEANNDHALSELVFTDVSSSSSTNVISLKKIRVGAMIYDEEESSPTKKVKPDYGTVPLFAMKGLLGVGDRMEFSESITTTHRTHHLLLWLRLHSLRTASLNARVFLID